MNIAALPPDEELRLEDLYSFNLLDSPYERDFDELVELAVQLCNSPISLITLLDKDRQWFKAKVGFNLPQTSRDYAFCAYTILQDEVFIVEDAKNDERFTKNPLVTNEGIRFYAGTPIISPDGYKLGTICIIDKEPKKLTDAQKRALTILSNQVTKLLQLRKNNVTIRKRAKEITDLKTKNIGRVLQGREDDKMLIATTLHEDIAQRIASDILLLDVASKNKEKAYEIAEKIKADLKDILDHIRTLTYSIVPYSLQLIPADELVAEFANKLSSEFGFDISVTINKSDKNGTPANALSAIRVIEQWFRLLWEEKTIHAINLTIETNTHFQLIMEYNSSKLVFKKLQDKLQDSMIYDRVFALNGSIEYSFKKGKNLLNVCLPVTEKEAE